MRLLWQIPFCFFVSALQPFNRAKPILMKIYMNTLQDVCQCRFSSILTSWRPFYLEPLGHSWVFIWGLIFFKCAYDVAYTRALFAIENQRDRIITSIRNGVPRIGRWPFRPKKTTFRKKTVAAGHHFVTMLFRSKKERAYKTVFK